MEQAQPRPFRPSLSLSQLTKLVVFAAIASACVAPCYHLVEIGVASWPESLILGGVSVPVALALAAFPLVRKGPLKDWLIRASLLASVTVAVGFAVFLFGFHFAGWTSRRMPFEAGFFATDALVIVLLGLAFAVLAKGIAPRKCPDCSRWSMILDAKAPKAPGEVGGRPYACLCCPGQSRRP